MGLELAQFGTVQSGLKEQKNTAYTLSQDLQARLDTPLLQDDTNLWRTFLDSRTMQLYGGVNDDQRHRFKIDHSFDLSAIVDANINADGSVTIEPTKYSQSQGTEFIIISRNELNGADKDYAIRADKYQGIKHALDVARNGGEKLKIVDLLKNSGFKVNKDLAIEEVVKLTRNRSITSLSPADIQKLKEDDFEYVHDGWREHCVGKNKAEKQDYLEAAKLLVKYVPEAQKNGCFKEGVGMGWYVETDSNDYKARSWYVYYSDGGSRAGGRGDLNCDGRFLRVRGSVAAKGGDAQKIDYVAISHPFNNPPKELDPALLGRALNPEGAKVLSFALAAYLSQPKQ